MTFSSINPATGETIWSGNTAKPAEIEKAVITARSAFETWAETPITERIRVIRAWGKQLEDNRQAVTDMIMRETGKAAWDAASEAGAMIGKTELSIKAQEERAGTLEKDLGANQLRIGHRPHGIMVVLGPYNFPGHLPNGHIVPALLAGNAVIFKPSEQTPATAELMKKLWSSAGLPEGLLQVLHGGADVAQSLVGHDDVNGILFTGGEKAGRAIHRALAGKPEKMLALELGGNAPLVVWQPRDIDEAAEIAVKSAFTSSGQRCTCARRLIISNDAEGQAVLDAVTGKTRTLVTDAPDADGAFMGSLISDQAASTVLSAQSDLLKRGGTALLKANRLPLGDAFVSPAIIDVTDANDVPDEEVFGPMLQVTRVSSFDDAIAEANNTRFGLAAGLVSKDRSLFDRFLNRVNAGIVNFNAITVGASGAAPFGGVGASGNHRPAGYHAADYSAWPIASLINEQE